MCDDLLDTRDVFRMATFEFSPLNENIESQEKMEKVIAEFDAGPSFVVPADFDERQNLEEKNKGLKSQSKDKSILERISEIRDSVLREEENREFKERTIEQRNIEQVVNYDNYSMQHDSIISCSQQISLVRQNIDQMSLYDSKVSTSSSIKEEQEEFFPLREITQKNRNQNNVLSKQIEEKNNENSKNKMQEEHEFNFKEISNKIYEQCKLSKSEEAQQNEESSQNNSRQQQQSIPNISRSLKKENIENENKNQYLQSLECQNLNKKQVQWKDEQENQKGCSESSSKKQEQDFQDKENLYKQECINKGLSKIKELGDTIKSSLCTMQEKFNEAKICVESISEEKKYKELWDSRLSDFYNKLFSSASQALFAPVSNIETPAKPLLKKPQSVLKFSTSNHRSVKPPSTMKFNTQVSTLNGGKQGAIFIGNSAKPGSTLKIMKPGSAIRLPLKPGSTIKSFKQGNPIKSYSTVKFNPPSMLQRQKQSEKVPSQTDGNTRQKSFTVQKFNLSNRSENSGILNNSKSIKKELPQNTKNELFFKK